jgi:hypothetical protein
MSRIHGNRQVKLTTITDDVIATNAAIADTKLATITTAGKVANSATTASVSPVADTIVLRNGLGEIQDLMDALIDVHVNEYIGQGNGTTTVFNVANGEYTPGSLQVYINGLLMKKDSFNVEESDPATGEFTFAAAPESPDEIIVSYFTGAQYALGEPSFSPGDGLEMTAGRVLQMTETGVTPGTYKSVAVDANGRVTSGTNPTTIADYGITDALSLDGGSMNGSLYAAWTPSDPLEVATKSYVDSVAAGLMDYKASVFVATTGNINLSNPGWTIDGVTCGMGCRVLVKDQDDATENGIYDFQENGSSPLPMTRSEDFDGTPYGEVSTGAYCFVDRGTVNANTSWVLTTPGQNIAIGTTELEFTQFARAGEVHDGAGLSLTGNILAVGAGDGIQVDADSVTVKLDGSTLSKSSSGLKVADNTFAAASHNQAATTVTFGANGTHWASTAPSDVEEALDRLASVLYTHLGVQIP